MKKELAPMMIERTKEIINDKEFQQENVMDPTKDFIRNRKMGFSGAMMYVLGNSRENLFFNSEKYAEAAGLESISAAAICKARAKIQWTAFESVFEQCALIMSMKKDFNGYQLLAVDGMKGEMPNLNSLKSTYPVNGKQGYPMFHALSVYNVMNDFFMAATFRPAPADEREMAMELQDKITQRSENNIWIFDRGFPSVQLIYNLEKAGQKFVMRVSNNFLKEVNDFTRGRAVDKSITITFDARRAAGKSMDIPFPYTFTLRCVRIRLDSGIEEILITNLNRKEFPKRKIKQIYGLRWGIEISYNYLKHAIFIEEFTSRKENGIKQDFYASLWAANLTNAAISDAMPPVIKKTKL